ncbi:MAG: hypothetical protein ACR2LQ_06395 [Acidimicrobiales bacterium]
MGERVSAVPSRLLEHAAISIDVADLVSRNAAALGASLELVRARCGELMGGVADVEADVAGVASQVRSIAALAHEVGLAFAAAGGVGTDGVAWAEAGAVEAALGRQWSPDRKLVAMTPSSWRRAVWGERCDSGDWFYGGGRGGIVGPDGRVYPLVSPSVVRGGLVYNAEWGRRGSAAHVGDLLGADPGWHTVDVESGVERHRPEPSWFERAMIGLGSTVAGPPIASTARDVEAVVLAAGELPSIARAPTEAPYPDPIAPTPPAPKPLGGDLVDFAPTVLDFSLGALTADNGANDAYRIEFDENVDGRLRATYLRVDVVPAAASMPAGLASSHVVGPDLEADRVPVRYLGPDGAVVREAEPRYVVATPPRGQVPGDR